MDVETKNLKEDVYGDFDGKESNISVDDGSSHERKFESCESNSDCSPDVKKSKSISSSEEEEVKFEEGFGELAAMDVFDEEDDDDMIIITSPRPRLNRFVEEYRYSDWWASSKMISDDDDIIDPQVWEAALRLYHQQISASNGFDVDDFKGQCCGFGMIIPLRNFRERSSFKDIHQLSVLAIEKYNDDNGTRYQFVEVEKVNGQLTGDFVYYITFKAKQIADAKTTFFQAVGYSGFPDKKGKEDLSVLYCRLKPTN